MAWEHPIKRVTNEAVLAALRDIYGFQFPPDFDMRGAQNSEFARRVYDHLRATGQRFDPEVFRQGVLSAKDLEQINQNPNWSAEQKFFHTLRAYRIPEDQWGKIHQEAEAEQKRMGPGVREGGKPYSDLALTNAAARVLGADSPVMRAATERAGLTPPPPPPGAPGGLPATGGGGDFGGPPPAAPAPPTAPAPKTTPTGPSKPPGGPAPPPSTPAPPLGKPTPDYSKMNDQQLEAELRKTFGKNVWVLNIPEIKKIVFDEMRNASGVTQDVITSAIQATPWWQQNGQKVADFLQDQATDARSLNDRIFGKQRQVEKKAAAFGMVLSPQRVLEIATDWVKWDWDEDAVNLALAGEFDTQEGEHTGFIDSLHADAKKYLVPLSEGTIDAWGKRIIMHGEAEKGNWNQFLKEQAIAMFPGLRDRLMGNETVMDIAKPYASLAAQYLEINENDIDFMKPQWMTALDTVDDKGVHKSMSPADWVRKIKTDSVYRYDYTEQAKKQATGIATDLLKKFGAI